MLNKKGKVTIILSVLLVVVLSVAGFGFYSLLKEKNRVKELQSNMSDLEARLKSAQLKLDETKRSVDGLSAKLQDAENKIREINASFEQERQANQDKALQLAQLKSEFERQNAVRFDAEKRLAQAQNELSTAEKKLKDLEAIKKDLEQKAAALEEKSKAVELGEIVVNPDNAPVAAAAGKKSSPVSLEAKVLVVNKDYDFAVINLGSKDGIAIGNTYSIYQKNKVLGEAKVEKVQESMSAVNLITAKMKNKINVGDIVVLKSK